jgi:transcriptional regulator with XRE-family HTH domain
MGAIRPYLGEVVADDELYVQPGRRMPTLAAALVVQSRQRSGLTQDELARRAATSRSAISAIEHGKRDPGLSGLEKIVRAAGFDLLIALTAHDDHDEVLKVLGATVDADTRRARNVAAAHFYDQAREAMKHSRPLIER